MSPGSCIEISYLGIIISIVVAGGCYSCKNEDGESLCYLFLFTFIILLFLSIVTIFVTPTESSRSTVQTDSTHLILYEDSYYSQDGNYYYYHYETSEGIKSDKIPANKTTIKLNGTNPLLNKNTVTTKTTTHWYWFFYDESENISDCYELLVPEGSVATDSTCLIYTPKRLLLGVF